ncbi:MAG: hypothetical protein ACM3X6_09510 [Patescibacteria group bacterium]
MGKLRYINCCLGALLTIFFMNGCKTTYIVAKNNINIYKNQYDPAFYMDKQNKIKLILKNGERVKLLKIKYDKNYAAYKVMLSNGDIGYIFSGSSMKFEEID